MGSASKGLNRSRLHKSFEKPFCTKFSRFCLHVLSQHFLKYFRLVHLRVKDFALKYFSYGIHLYFPGHLVFAYLLQMNLIFLITKVSKGDFKVFDSKANTELLQYPILM